MLSCGLHISCARQDIVEYYLCYDIPSARRWPRSADPTAKSSWAPSQPPQGRDGRAFAWIRCAAKSTKEATPGARAVRSGESAVRRRRSCLAARYQEMASSSCLLFLVAPTRCAMVAEPQRQQKSSVHRERRATKNRSQCNGIRHLTSSSATKGDHITLTITPYGETLCGNKYQC